MNLAIYRFQLNVAEGVESQPQLLLLIGVGAILCTGAYYWVADYASWWPLVGHLLTSMVVGFIGGMVGANSRALFQRPNLTLLLVFTATFSVGFLFLEPANYLLACCASGMIYTPFYVAFAWAAYRRGRYVRLCREINRVSGLSASF